MPNPQVGIRARVRTALPTLSLLTLGLLAACSESATIASENETFLDLSQAQIVAVSGAQQEGEVGSFLPEPLTVEVRSQGGTPMAGVAVEWVFLAGQGVTTGNGSGSTSTSLTSYTDSRGRTSAAWLLGTRAGTQQSSAQVLIPVPSSQTTASGAPPGHDKGNKVGFSAKAKPGSVATLDVSPGEASMRPGDAIAMTAVAQDSHGNTLQDVNLNWQTSNAEVATVDQSGTVTARSTGEAVISAKSGPVQDFATITAIADGTAAVVAVAGQNQTGVVGQPLAAAPTVEVRDAGGQPVPNVTVTWSVASGSGSVSSATTTTNSSGRASVTWTLGTTTGPKSLYAASAGLPGVTFNATAIEGPVAVVLVSPAGAQLDPGQTLQASAEAQDGYGNVVRGKTPSWSTSNTAVLKVDAGGRVTAVASGTADVRATIDGVTGSQAVNVNATGTPEPTPAYLEVSPSSVSLTVGQTQQLTATVRDSLGNPLSGYSLSFATSNSSVIGVDAMGLLTAKAAGTALIFVSTVCCSVSDTVAVEVAQSVVGSNPGGKNEPAGMTTIYNNPGTSLNWASEGWDFSDTNGVFSERVTLATGQANPTGQNTVIRISYPAEPTISRETRFNFGVRRFADLNGVTIGNVRELYVRMWVKFNGEGPGGKLFYAGLSPEADGDPLDANADFFVTVERSGGMGYTEQGTGRGEIDGYLVGPGNMNEPFPNTGSNWKTAWHVFEMHLVAESSVGAHDGYATFWLNGKLLDTGSGETYRDGPHTFDDIYWSAVNGSESSFNGFRWVLNQPQGGDGAKHWNATVDYGELYISGKAR